MTARSAEHVIVAGAGPIGLSCAISAARRGLHPLVIDAGAVCNAIVRYPVGMSFFTTPERMEIGGHPLVCSGHKPTREEALKYYRGVARAEGLRIRTFTRLSGAHRLDGGIECRLETRGGNETLACDKLVLATGYFDHPNLLGVPGEELPQVSHYFREAHLDYGLDVVVIGGRNSAVEAALELFRTGARVTLVYRGLEFPRSVKYWLKPDIQNRISAGEIKAYMGSSVERIESDHIVIAEPDGSPRELPAQRVYALTGFHPDFDLFRRVGITLDLSEQPELNPDTLETTVPGVYMVGSITRGRRISDVFIENGRFDGERVFGNAEARATATRHYEEMNRYYGE